MEFKVPVESLQDTFSCLAHVTKLTANDLTSLVYAESGDGSIDFSTTDGQINLTVTCRGVEIITPGKILFRLSDLKGYVGKFTPLNENYGTKEFHVICGEEDGVLKSKTLYRNSKPSYRKLSFALEKTALFKPFRKLDSPAFIVNSSSFRDGIAKVINCINPSEIRRAMAGLSLSIDSDKLIFAGTNGVKLSEAVVSINTAVQLDEYAYVFSYGLASALLRILKDNSQVIVSFEGRNVYIRSDDVYISGPRIMNEPYPNYRPKFNEASKKIVLPTLDLTDSVISVLDVLDSEDNSRLTLNVKDNVLTIRNERVEITQEFDNEFSETLDVDVNGEYLSSILTGFGGDLIEVCFEDSLHPLVFRTPGTDEYTTLLTVVKRR